MHRLSLLKNWACKPRKSGGSAAIAAMLLILLGSATLLAAQKQKNDKNAKDAKETEITGIGSLMPLPDAQGIELMLSQMLATWQIGDDAAYVHEKYVTELIPGTYLPETLAGVLRVIERQAAAGADGVLLAGTELPLLLHRTEHAGIPLLDTTSIHVRQALAELLK